jgi:hypothetical protein
MIGAIIVAVILVPLILLSFANRNKTGSKFGPIVCSSCSVELRGWNSSGQKQIWYHDDPHGNRVYFCARCRPKVR